MSIEKITLGYWSTKGLGSASRQMIIYAGAPLIAKIYRLIPKLENNSLTYDGSEWHEKDKIILKKKNSLINLPYLQFNEAGKEKIIAQSITCLTYLGKKFNMFGENSKEELDCNQFLQETVDLRNIVTRFAYTHFENENDELNEASTVFNQVFEHSNAGKLQKFEHWLSKKNNSETKLFLIGNNISSPDFNLFDTLELYVEFLKYYKFVKNINSDNFFEQLGFPLVSKFFLNFKTLPKMQKYFNSILYKFPYTNKSAKFGSGKNGITWDHNKEIDSTPEEIIIE
jgi:hypothetical protein